MWWSALAFAGSFDGEVALDTLHAQSTTEEPFTGESPTASATELGVRVLGEVEELDDRLVIGVDYRGREALGGTYPNAPLRLLYRGDVAWETESVEVGLGRFQAPSVLWLPMDGGRVTLRFDEASWLTVYGGRRGISASRRPLPFDAFLPAVGAQLGRTAGDYQAEVLGGFSGDRLVFGPPDAEVTDDVSGASGRVRLGVTRWETVAFGGQLSAARNATYGVSTVAGTFDVSVQALSLYDGLAWVSGRPARGVRWDVHALHQRAEVAAVEAPVDVVLVDPSFTDLRARGALGDPDHLWVRPDVRLRLREGRSELRYGGGADVRDLGVMGPFVRGRLWLEDIGGELATDDVGAIDRVLWTASGGYERGAGTLEAGASFVERAAAPLSGRVSSASNPSAPLASDDLSTFALAAQETAFVRGFLASRRWFAGADLEANLGASGGFRAFVQVGLLGDASW